MFLCNFCMKSFTQKKSVKRHLMESCETIKNIDINKLMEIYDILNYKKVKIKIIKCYFCEKSFTQKKNVKV